mmetsp:Transcript_19631/g.32726  ORF Transcript_19631/g.32726 Transcript_19631/m.32726 type:complete len:420 (+) Transcript_19631:196-1455(+)
MDITHASGRLIVSCTLMLVLSTPVVVPPVLYSSIATSLGIAQAHVTALMPAAYATGSFALTMPGSLFMEHFGVRQSFVLGVTFQSIFVTMQILSLRLWQLVALQAALGMCHCFAGTVGFIAFCNAWFGEHPSTAISLNFAAFGLAGALWTPLAAAITGYFEWRTALACSAGLQWCVALPLAVCGMHDPPPASVVRRPSRVAREPSLELDRPMMVWWLMDGSVWLLALLSSSVLYVTYSVNNSATLFFVTEAAVPLSRASFYTSLIYAGNMAGKTLIGPLYDSRHGGACAVGACALLVSGSAVLWHLAWHSSGGIEALVFAIVFGLGYGGAYALVQSKAALHFGHRHGFKAMQGFLYCWQMAGTISGEIITPELAHAKSFAAAFAAVTGIAVSALVALLAFEAREVWLSRVSSQSQATLL